MSTLIPLDNTICMARMKKDLSKQCKCKKKPGSDYCGRHIKCNNISRIDESEYIVSETGGIVSFYKTNYTDVDIDKEPNITFFRYVGDTGFQTPIKFGLDTSKNSLSNIFNNDLFISTDTNKIYRYNGSDTTWKEILGSGSSSGSSNNNNNNIIFVFKNF